MNYDCIYVILGFLNIKNLLVFNGVNKSCQKLVNLTLQNYKSKRLLHALRYAVNCNQMNMFRYLNYYTTTNEQVFYMLRFTAVKNQRYFNYLLKWTIVPFHYLKRCLIELLYGFYRKKVANKNLWTVLTRLFLFIIIHHFDEAVKLLGQCECLGYHKFVKYFSCSDFQFTV